MRSPFGLTLLLLLVRHHLSNVLIKKPSNSFTFSTAPLSINCPSYSISDSQSGVLTYASCNFQACGGTIVTVSGCDQCIGDQLIRLFNSSSEVEMTMDDDGCGQTASCSLLTFTVSGPSHICDTVFAVREACWSDDSCSGTISLYGVDALSTVSPSAKPTRRPSTIKPTRSPSTTLPSISDVPIVPPTVITSSQSPSDQPSVIPNDASTNSPSSVVPWQLLTTKAPIGKSSLYPTGKPSEQPVTSESSTKPLAATSIEPSSNLPTTFKPSTVPSRNPSIRQTMRPTTAVPTTIAPTFRPSTLPTRVPTKTPTVRPSTRQPSSSRPTASPTYETRWVAAPTSPLTHWTQMCSDSSGLYFVAATESLGVYHSTDSGATWLSSDAPNECGWSSLSCSSDGAKVFAVCDGVGVYSSLNYGMSWKLFNVDTNRRRLNAPEIVVEALVSVVHMAISGSGATMFAVMSDGTIVRSITSGTTWTEIVTNHPSSEVFCTPSAQHVLALGQNDCVFWSSTSGSDWSVLSVDCVGFTTATISDSGQYLTLTARDSAVCYYSTNYGASFVSYDTGAPYAFNSLVASSNGQYLAATSSGVDCIRLSSTYGLTWACSPSSAVAQWTTLSMDSSGSGIVAGGANTQLYSLQTVYGDDDMTESENNKKNFWDPIVSFKWNSYAGYAIILGGLLVLCLLTQQCVKWKRARAVTQANRRAVNRTLDLQSIASSHLSMERVLQVEENTTPVVIHRTTSSLANAMYDRDADITPQRVSSRPISSRSQSLNLFLDSNTHMSTKFSMLGIVDEFGGAPSAPPVVDVQMPRHQTHLWEMEHHQQDSRDAGFYEIDLNRMSFTQHQNNQNSSQSQRGRGAYQYAGWESKQLDQIDYDDLSIAQV